MGSIIVQFIRRVIKLAVVISVGYHCYQLLLKLCTLSFSQGKIGM
jgi:hypothetical protein